MTEIINKQVHQEQSLSLTGIKNTKMADNEIMQGSKENRRIRRSKF